MSFRQLVACLLTVAAGSACANTPVFINEMHYDNAGNDSNEGVEIAGPALTDLSTWSVVFYNGSGGTVYMTVPLSGFLPNQCGGFGTVSVPALGMQNGSPDGVALVNGSTVVQFLSYEGTFTATEGPAAGQLSTDIGVSESGTSPVGDSLQLAGTGSTYEDFTWQPSAPSSFGQCNAGQTFVGGVDAPPTVLNLTPSDGATGVAESTTIQIQFSEAVDLASNAVTLSCSQSGSVALNLTSNPNAASYTFTPAPAAGAGNLHDDDHRRARQRRRRHDRHDAQRRDGDVHDRRRPAADGEFAAPRRRRDERADRKPSERNVRRTRHGDG